MNFFLNLVKKLSHKREITRVGQKYVEKRQKKDFYYLPTQFYMMQNFRGQEKRQENRNNRKFELHFKKLFFFFNFVPEIRPVQKEQKQQKTHIKNEETASHTTTS